MNKNMSDSIFGFALGCAMADAVIRNAYPHHKIVKKKGSDEYFGEEVYIPTPKNKLIKEYPAAMQKVKSFVDKILEGEFSSKDDYDKKFEETVLEIRENMKKNGFREFTFGNIQKLINITLKHLYILGYRDENLRENFRFCHCPLDTQIARTLLQTKYDYENHPERFTKDKVLNAKTLSEEKDAVWKSINRIARSDGITWSNLDGDEDIKLYFEIQDKIKNIREADPQNRGNNSIEFDYLFWDYQDKV